MLNPDDAHEIALADAECIKLVESIGFSSVPTLQKIVAGIRVHLKKVLAGAKDAEAKHNAQVPKMLAAIEGKSCGHPRAGKAAAPTNPDDCVSVTARGRQLIGAPLEPRRFMLLQDALEHFDCPANVEGHCIGIQCPAFARRQATVGNTGDNTTRNVELVCTWGNSIQTIGVIEEIALEAAGRICPLVKIEAEGGVQ